MSELRGRKAGAVVRDVKNVVEPLQKCEAVDEVESLPRGRANARHNEVDAVGVPAYQGIQLEGV